jgi:hypothetical protein
MPLWRRPYFALKIAAVWAFLIWERIGIARDVGGAPQDNNFTVTGAKDLGVDISVADLMDTCLAENDRRLGAYDPRLLRPNVVPRTGAFGAAVHAWRQAGSGVTLAGDRVLITGASGFVGSAVARAAVARGYRVRALVRPTSPRANFAGWTAKSWKATCARPASFCPALKDVQFVFHVAADYRLWARNPDEIIRNNREGTRVGDGGGARGGRRARRLHQFGGDAEAARRWRRGRRNGSCRHGQARSGLTRKAKSRPSAWLKT